jgi:phage shock protein A
MAQADVPTLPDQGRPDPSILTTDALQREVAIIDGKFEAQAGVREREHASLEKHVISLIGALKDITLEQFQSILTQLGLIERQRVEQKKDTKDAVDAALSAAKEAVKEQTTASERSIAKSETATTKQLEQLTATFSTAISGVTTSINDLKDSNNNTFGDMKDRIGKVETAVSNLAATKAGIDEHRVDNRAGNSQTIAIGMAVLVMVQIAVAIFVAVKLP